MAGRLPRHLFAHEAVEVQIGPLTSTMPTTTRTETSCTCMLVSRAKPRAREHPKATFCASSRAPSDCGFHDCQCSLAPRSRRAFTVTVPETVEASAEELAPAMVAA